MLTQYMMRAFQTAAKEKGNIKIIRNTAANGDDYYIKPYETTVLVYNSGSYTQNLFLPKIGECVGQIIYVGFPDFGGGGTLADQDDCEEWSDLTNDADTEYGVFMNTGRTWATLISDL